MESLHNLEIKETHELLNELEALHEIFTEFQHLVAIQDVDIEKIHRLLEYDNELIRQGTHDLDHANTYHQQTNRYVRIGLMTCIGSLGFFAGVSTGCITTLAGGYIGYFI